MYESIGIDIRRKTIIYSDALILDRVLQLKEQCDDAGFRSEWVLVGNHTLVVISFSRLFWNRDILYE